MYLVHTPWWLRALYPKLVWQIPVKEKVLYLSFDDGPHETATPFVLDQLQQYGAKASFFCIGKNVMAHPAIYERIIREGHAVGNHTQHHLNGWKTPDQAYIKDINLAAEHIHSTLFRPPYGRIRRSQYRQLKAAHPNMRVIMWSVLSGDFDTGLSPETGLSYVLQYAKPGSIIVFHDSAKAWDRLQYALPRVLAHFKQEGYRFESI
ncbi:Peptidoglycan/xylan/chitin deacetylase, PgdA/CDA1 family [Hydrobacter penzbergensis]|uniref:Peptidoglycan/xylan/chitin deacetylase, PgdA/CDA1 family n=1 Tax=Hydrobacter penzbergensis TaxID=1235997 RepID=A0A8X8II46_9BACT|nr:polysaccharide deacetylase family protein [Hydrobacter penzbergensis]SDX14164.1 Peptidoglycan/xylan/chitin deacetylase, PgdA/CDA1 family [Hydrobacter penzbergensis]